jgi:hypothetical protein
MSPFDEATRRQILGDNLRRLLAEHGADIQGG